VKIYLAFIDWQRSRRLGRQLLYGVSRRLANLLILIIPLVGDNECLYTRVPAKSPEQKLQLDEVNVSSNSTAAKEKVAFHNATVEGIYGSVAKLGNAVRQRMLYTKNTRSGL
jgi:hypothetical protein